MKSIYAGSFDPFTMGHYYCLKQASEIFDKVYLVISVNSNKERKSNVLEMKEAIEKTVADLKNVEVVTYSGLIADFAKQMGIKYFVRGIRNTTDFNYEENIAKINKELNSELRTIYFKSNDEFLSSSLIWELKKFNKDYSKYVPKEVYKVLNK